MRRAQLPGAESGGRRSAAQRRARIKVQGRAITPAPVKVTAMGGINAAIDVGKHQLESRWAVMASYS